MGATVQLPSSLLDWFRTTGIGLLFFDIFSL